MGAPTATSNGTAAQGRVYLYDVRSRWSANEVPEQTLESSAGFVGDQFGRAIAINRHTIVSGVPLADRQVDPSTTLIDIGRADPFELDGILRSDFE